MSEPIKWTNTTIKLSQLKPWDQNPRQSTQAQAKRILQSMADFGQVQTVAIGPDGEVYDGHQRLSALLAVYGADYELDARQSSRALTDYERRGLVLALHATAAGEWDWDELANWDLPSLLPDGFARDWLGQLNYDGAMVATMLEADGVAGEGEEADAEPQVSRADELQAEWGTELGQLWQIGEHRLLIGDCTVAENVERLMGGEKADITFTSPPYNLGKNISISNRAESLKQGGTVYEGFSDDLSAGDYSKLLYLFTQNSLAVSDYVFVNIQQLAGNKIEVIDYLHSFRQHFADVAIWHKTNPQPAMAENVINSSFEYVFIFSSETNPTRAIKTANFRGTFSNVYTSAINVNEFSDLHGAGFPLDFATHFIKAFCPTHCIDVFCGTGTTMVAAQNLGRKCYGMEISPAYGAVILQRMVDAFPTLDIYQVD